MNATLQQKIDQQRRKARYREIIRQLRIRYYTYEDVSEEKAQRSVDLIGKIRETVLKPCPCCGDDR